MTFSLRILLAVVMGSTLAVAQSQQSPQPTTRPQFLKPLADPLALPDVKPELELSRQAGGETDPILRILGDYPSTKGSLGRLMGDRKDAAYRDPIGKVVAFQVLNNGDVLFGPNVGIKRRVDKNDPTKRLETDPQHTSPIDFYWDARDRKLHVRSILLTENGDPADLAFRRSGDETYPYGPPMAIKAGMNLGTMYWMGWGADDYGFDDRVAQIYARAAEDITRDGAGGTLLFSTTPLGATKPVDRVAISSEGQVGIGTTAPHATLHVVGNGAGDEAGVAEDYPSEEKLEAGDVVAIDDQAAALSIARAAKPYDQRIVGVVATRPAVRISHPKTAPPGNTQTKPVAAGFPVAHGGRVPVKVCVENGPIRPGDYLTSSSTPGVAMKATAKGAVVGKALQPFSADSTGRILMLADVTWYQP